MVSMREVRVAVLTQQGWADGSYHAAPAAWASPKEALANVCEVRVHKPTSPCHENVGATMLEMLLTSAYAGALCQRPAIAAVIGYIEPFRIAARYGRNDDALRWLSKIAPSPVDTKRFRLGSLLEPSARRRARRERPGLGRLCAGRDSLQGRATVQPEGTMGSRKRNPH